MRHMAHRAVLGVAAVLLLAVSLLPSAALAAGNPQADPTCWTAKDCTGGGATGTLQITGSVGGTITTHWEEDAVACGTDWGRCFPGGKIPISVHLPTRGGALTEVSNIGQYIGTVFTWGIRVAAILAVIAIMVGGVLWMTSGAAGTLQKGKDLIRNAVIGLLLALGSYLILQTVNPDLVKLTAPRLYMVRPIVLQDSVAFCDSVPADVPVYDTGTTRAVADRVSLACGLKFDTAVGTNSTCIGRRCEPRQVCVPFTATEFHCREGVLGGRIDYLTVPVGSMRLLAVCSDGGSSSIDTAHVALLSEQDHTQEYRFLTKDATRSLRSGSQSNFLESEIQAQAVACGGQGSVVGYVLDIDGTMYGREVCGGVAEPIPTSLDELGKQIVFHSKLFSIAEIQVGMTSGAIEGGMECSIRLGS